MLRTVHAAGSIAGVTTIVTGNCSLSVAPVRNRHDADRMIDMFYTIEDIKPVSFAAGVPFEQWTTFGDWLRWLQPSLSINVAALVGHSAVRLFVMGAGCQEREATDAELAEMCAVVEEAMAAGALGVSTSYVDIDSRKVRKTSAFYSCIPAAMHGLTCIFWAKT
jgi:N-acyl-D-aspartate/D-glutamate deacylase